MKLWIVTDGKYSDCRVIAILDSREKADALLLALPNYCEPEITDVPFDINTVQPEAYKLDRWRSRRMEDIGPWQ